MTGCTDRSPLTFPHGRNGLGLENQKKAERKHKGLHFCIFCKSFERLAPSLPPGTIRQRVKLGEAGVRGWLWGKKGRDDIHQATKVCESCLFLRQLSFRQIIPRASSDSAPCHPSVEGTCTVDGRSTGNVALLVGCKPEQTCFRWMIPSSLITLDLI